MAISEWFCNSNSFIFFWCFFANFTHRVVESVPLLDDGLLTDPNFQELPPTPSTTISSENLENDDRNEVIPNSEIDPNEIDFSKATRNEAGKLCVLKEEMVQSVIKEPMLQCTHKKVEKCHYTYITKFVPTKEEVNTF